MGTIENQLKQLILDNYDSVSAFLKKNRYATTNI